MKKEEIIFSFSQEKNISLIMERGISFERVIYQVEHGHVLDVVLHPNQKKYPGQKIFILNVDGYAYLVPFVQKESGIFLKTIIPSRKHTKQYLRGKNDR